MVLRAVFVTDRQLKSVYQAASFITAHIAYASTNKTKIAVLIETVLWHFQLPGAGLACLLHACFDAMLLSQSFVKTQTFPAEGPLTASVE